NGKPVLDLKAEDVEVFEDNTPQSIQSFEHVVVQPGPQSMRTDPGSIGQSLDIAANPRNRVFIVFLDQKHVSMVGSWNIREPLIRMLDEMLGPDDRVGVMTSDMSASDVTLGRKTDVLAGGLMRLWPWGQRGMLDRDEREYEYETCFPNAPDVVQEMITRRRERMTFEALHELVRYLRNIREE